MSANGRTVTFDMNVSGRMNKQIPLKSSNKGTRERFTLGDFDIDSLTSTKQNGLHASSETALKDELLDIFQREKAAMELQYANKVQELLRGFKNKKAEWEQIVKEEREELEQELENEKSEIHRTFAQEISKMTRNFETEKIDLEKSYELKIAQLQKEHDEMARKQADKHGRIMDELKKELEMTFDSNLKFSIDENDSKWRQKLEDEIEDLKKRQVKEKEATDESFEKEREQIEKRYRNDIIEAEKKFEKIKFEMEQTFEEEKRRVHKEWLKKVEEQEEDMNKEKKKRRDIEERVRQEGMRVCEAEEKLKRVLQQKEDVERQFSSEKSNLSSLNSMLKSEISQLKDEIDFLRKKQVSPAPEMNEAKNGAAQDQSKDLSKMTFDTRADLPLHLRDDFDRLIGEYKENIKSKFKKEKDLIEEKYENKRKNFKAEVEREKYEMEKRLNDERQQMEKEIKSMRDEMEKEIERRLHTKQLQDSLQLQQQKIDEATKRLEEEDRRKRLDFEKEVENGKISSVLNDARRENEGLKMKISALEENNRLLKQMKEESQNEIDRLRKSIEDLRTTVIEASKRDSIQPPPQPTPSRPEYPIIMPINIPEPKRDTAPPPPPQPAASPSPVTVHIQQPPQSEQNTSYDRSRELEDEKRRLEELRRGLEKQEMELRHQQTIENAAKIAVEKSQMRYETLSNDKSRLESSLESLEKRVISMQNEMMALKQKKADSPITINNQPPQQQAQSPVQQPQPTHFQVPTFLPIPPGSPVHPGQIPSANSLESTLYQEMKEKVKKLKGEREELTRRLQETQVELRDAKRENSSLEKQIASLETQLEKVENKLEKETENVQRLKEQLDIEKQNERRSTDELEREKDKVDGFKKRIEDLQIQHEKETKDLQERIEKTSKLNVELEDEIKKIKINKEAGTKKQKQRHQPVDEVIDAVESNRLLETSPEWNFPEDDDEAEVQEEIEQQQQPEELFAENEFDYPMEENDVIQKTDTKIANTANQITGVRTDNDIIQSESKIKELEREKEDLQKRLFDAKNALNAYTTKLDDQLRTIEWKASDSELMVQKSSTQNINTTTERFVEEKGRTAEENWKLLNQKMQLQRLIERLTRLQSN